MMPEHPQAVLTRPEGMNDGIALALKSAGWGVTIAPALNIESRVLLPGESLPDPDDFDLVVFVSLNAVNGFAEQWSHRCNWPVHTIAACVGLTTAQAVRDAFGSAVRVLHPDAGQNQDSESLWSVICQLPQMPQRVLIVRGQNGRDWLAGQFSLLGIEVQFHVAYCREITTWSSDQLRLFERWALEDEYPVWLLTSPHGIQSVFDQLIQAHLLEWAQQCSFIVTHPRLVDPLRLSLTDQTGKTCIKIARADQDDLLSCFEKIRQNHL